MDFFKFLKSLDELLYEVMSWLVFYPVTLWRTIRHPMEMLDYARAQSADGVAAPYADALSPPIFLLLTVLFAHGIELAAIGESSIVADTSGLAGLIRDDTSLILMRLVAFASFPVIVGTHFVVRSRAGLNRQTLEEPFYAQCYATAPFALAFSLAVTVSQVPRVWAMPTAAALLAVAALGWLAIETAWFARRLSTGLVRGLGNAVFAYALCLAGLLGLVWLLGGKGI